jgi:hypothetical protein
VQQHGGTDRRLALTTSPRRCRFLRQAPLTLLPLLLPLLLAVQPAQAAPATEAEMNLYTRIAAVNVCLARAAGVEFDKAVGIAGETIAQVIQGQHNGAIQQVGAKPLTLEELRQGSINSAVIGAVEVCPKQVPADVVKRVEEALKAQSGGSSGAKPAAGTPGKAPARPK